LQYKTFLTYMKVFDEDYQIELNFEHDVLNEGDEGTINIGDAEIPLIVGTVIGDNIKFEPLTTDYDISTSKEPITMSFSGLTDYLSGFEFSTVLLNIYIHTDESPLLEKLTVEFNNEKGESLGFKTTKGPCGLDGQDVYDGSEIPKGKSNANEIKDIVNNNDDLSIDYKIILPIGTEIESDWLDGTHKTSVELAIWLPLEFESLNDDAQFIFPDFFDGIGDVFKSVAGTGFIENININIGIHPQNPFCDGIFVIKDDKYDPIQNPLNNSSFSFGLNKTDVDYINKNSFDPKFYIIYPHKNTILGIPSGDFLLTSVSLNVGLKYDKEF